MFLKRLTHVSIGDILQADIKESQYLAALTSFYHNDMLAHTRVMYVLRNCIDIISILVPANIV